MVFQLFQLVEARSAFCVSEQPEWRDGLASAAFQPHLIVEHPAAKTADSVR